MGSTQHFQCVISADSHIYEPSDLWWKTLGQRLGEHTPRALETYQGQQGKFFYSGYQGCPVMRLREQNSPETEAAAVLRCSTASEHDHADAANAYAAPLRATDVSGLRELLVVMLYSAKCGPHSCKLESIFTSLGRKTR